MDRAANVGRLTFAFNVTLDGCCDHREMIADDEMHDHFTQRLLVGDGYRCDREARVLRCSKLWAGDGCCG